jgi:phospholipid/cholesterol/gamma-HCH transport system ATP-binding protein
MDSPARIEVRRLTISVEGQVVQRDLDFEVAAGQIFAVIGDGGSGRSLLLRHMAGMQRPTAGAVLYDGESLWGGSEADRERLRHRFGILFQGAVLIAEMTLLENVAVKLRLNTALSDREADEVAALKLAIMGLRGHERHYPSQVSVGMRIRAALARAIALDPDILFFDDPSALLDPLHSQRVDDIILGLRDATGATIVLVSHDLPSVFALADDALFLDGEKKTMIARGRPEELRDHCPDPKVRAFLTRGRA